MADPTLPDDLFLIHPDGGADSPEETTLSFRRSPTVLLNFAANRFTRMAARQYQEQFGIGAMDWRMLVMLTRAPGSSVAHASRTIGIDKAAVSRSLARLSEAGLAEARVEGPDARRKVWTLTREGQRLHRRILAVALDRQKHLLAGFTEDDVRMFTGYLTRFLENLDAIGEE